MTIDSYIDRMRQKLFKRKPPTVLSIYDDCVLSEVLQKTHGRRKTISQHWKYLKEKCQLARMTNEQKHNLVKEILKNVRFARTGHEWWLT
jgi:hypothetical protein